MKAVEGFRLDSAVESVELPTRNTQREKDSPALARCTHLTNRTTGSRVPTEPQCSFAAALRSDPNQENHP